MAHNILKEHLYEYLVRHGAFHNNDDQYIKTLKKQYWKEYRRVYKRLYRRTFKEPGTRLDTGTFEKLLRKLQSEDVSVAAYLKTLVNRDLGNEVQTISSDAMRLAGKVSSFYSILNNLVRNELCEGRCGEKLEPLLSKLSDFEEELLQEFSNKE